MAFVNIVPKPIRCSINEPDKYANIENIEKKIDEKFDNSGCYVMFLHEDKTVIAAADEKGFFYAQQSLRQLKAVYGDKIPCFSIMDSPCYQHRGVMLDSVRHMQSIEEIKKFIEAAALFKFNVFHWHLSDDQGFRFESEVFPELIKESSVRPSSDFGKVHDNTPYGGYYTKAQMKEIIDFCHARFITVIPEFDLPGHMSAVLHAKPELSCKGEPVAIKTTAGIFPDILCAGKEEVFDFLFKLFDEVCEVFPDEYFHIGGDEAPKKYWKTCPHCQKRKTELGFSDEEQLQGYMTTRIAEYLAKKGRKVICWNETLNSNILPENLIIQNWMDKKKKCAPFANNGGKLIYSDYYHYYTDYPYGMTPLRKTFSANPVIAGQKPDASAEAQKKKKTRPYMYPLRPDACASCIGVEAPIWTEHVRDFDRLCYMTWPRFAAVSETGWRNARHKDNDAYKDFKKRITALLPLLEEIGIKAAAPSEWDPVPVRRLFDTASFFAGTVNKEMIVNFFKGNND